MRTVVVRGGWQAWALLILGGAVVLVLGVTIGIVLLGLLAVGAVVLLGQRALRAFGIGVRPRPVSRASTAGGSEIIDGEFHVVSRSSATTVRQLPDGRQEP